MSHYEKIAMIAFRVIACCIAVFGLVGTAYGLVLNAFQNESAGIYFFASLIYVLIGLILFALSKPLATLIARHL
jgi:uncharacterized membrane protein YiaA